METNIHEVAQKMIDVLMSDPDTDGMGRYVDDADQCPSPCVRTVCGDVTHFTMRKRVYSAALQRFGTLEYEVVVTGKFIAEE